MAVLLKEIAKVAGVSVSTVSKALRDHSDISSHTKALIKQTAESMGYYDDKGRKEQKKRRAVLKHVGIIIPGGASARRAEEEVTISSYFVTVMEDSGYDCTFLIEDSELSYMTRIRIGSLDGVCIIGAQRRKADMLILADELCEEGIAVVTVDYSYHGICAVLHDAATTGRRNNAKLGEEAARLLIRRIEREPEAAEHIRIPGIPQQDNS